MSEDSRTISELFDDDDLINEALRLGVQDALRMHKRLGNPIAVWRDEKVVWIQSEDIQVPDEPE